MVDWERRMWNALTEREVSSALEHLRTEIQVHNNSRLRVNKKKAVLLQAWSGPEGSRKLRFPDFITTAQDGVKVASLTHRPPLPPGNTPGTPVRD